jgi:eukaryotic-like serine/threonine-protein kinase
MTPIEPGVLVGGRYELGRQLGSGGMARVFLAHDRLLDRDVAVKVLSEPYAGDPAFVERFRREASAAAGLNHPNIVAVYDRGEADGSYYIVMEYLSGPTLKDIIRRRGPLPPAEAVDVALGILAALAAAHKRGVIHRDVKPQNVMASEDGRIKVADFGIARAGEDSGMTEAGSIIGTAQYLSPEQARGDEVTAASDCYSVGIVLYELLTGRVPFDGDRSMAVAMKQIAEPPQPPHELRPDLPPDLEAVVLKALRKRPSERYRTAEEFSGDLRMMDAPTVATVAAPRRASVPPPQPSPPRRRARWPWTLLLLAIIAAGIAVAAFSGVLGDNTAKAAVPSVTNLSPEQAATVLSGRGFESRTEERPSEDVAKGLVIGTDPPEGTQASTGSPVVILVSSGPAPESVPDVRQRDIEAALALLQPTFNVEQVPEANDSAPKGTVLGQEPAANSPLSPGETVTLTVSSGPAEVEVPDVRGAASLQLANQELAAQGLKVGAVTQRPDDTQAEGTVIDQSPAPNTKVPRDSEVDLVQASRPTTATVPPVVGLDAQSARAELVAAGFGVRVNGQASDQPHGTVLAQDPPGGATRAPGTQVLMIVSTGLSSTSTVPGLPPPGSGTATAPLETTAAAPSR